MTPVSFMFSRRGCVTVSLENPTEHLDGLMGLAIQSGALDVDEAPSSADDPESESTFQVRFSSRFASNLGHDIYVSLPGLL